MEEVSSLLDETKLDMHGKGEMKVGCKFITGNFQLLVLQAASKTEVLERIELQMTKQLAPTFRTRRTIDMRVVRERQLEMR